MRNLSIAVFSMLLGAVASGAAAQSPLASFAWSARPVILFAENASDPTLRAQLAALTAARTDLSERDMPVIVVTADGVTIDGAPTPIAPEAMRAAYAVGRAEFALLLVGKDTGVKRRAIELTAPAALFDQVDAMPMRQREMRERQSRTGD